MIEDERKYTITSLSESLDLSKPAVQSWVESGELVAIDLASHGSKVKKWSILGSDVRDFLIRRANRQAIFNGHEIVALENDRKAVLTVIEWHKSRISLHKSKMERMKTEERIAELMSVAEGLMVDEE